MAWFCSYVLIWFQCDYDSRQDCGFDVGQESE